MKTPNLAAPLTSLVTDAVAVSTTRPVNDGDGASLSSWIVGGSFQPTLANVHVQADGADRMISDPTGGAEGVELWIQKRDRGGTLRWWRAAILNAGADIFAKTPGGFVAMVEIPPGATRAVVAGTPDLGAPTFYLEPIERYT